MARLIRRAAETQLAQVGPGVIDLQGVDVRTMIKGRGPDSDALRAVAIVYRLPYAAGEPPTEAVKDRLGLPRSTAARWVSLARDVPGLLPRRDKKEG